MMVPTIGKTDLECLFKRFYQADQARSSTRRRGTGLGLTIAKEILEAHGGYVEAESEYEIGTTFRVWLPAEHPSAPDSAV